MLIEKLISIIVPVYNVEKDLPYCLESIREQTYKNIETILVDDGSTDSSGDICNKFRLKDSRFRVFHQSNHGVAQARNAALSAAKGEYIAFIDSDDYVHPLMIETLYQACEQTGSKIAMCNYVRVNEHGVLKENVIKKPVVINQDKMMKMIFHHKDGILYHVTWNKLYKKEIIANEFFRDGKCEDTDFNLRAFLKAENMAIIDNCLYYFFERQGSLTRNDNYINSYFYDSTFIYYEYMKYFSSNEMPKYRGYCLSRVIKKYLNVVYLNSISKLENKKELLELEKVIKKDIKTTQIPLHENLAYRIFMHFPITYILFRKSIEKFSAFN